MNIKQALKKKNKLAAEIKTELQKFSRYNSVVEGTERIYNPRQAFESYQRKINSLISLKTAIHKANVPVYDKIFRLSELKSMIQQLRGISCESGTIHQRGGYGTPDSTVLMSADMTVLERDQLIEKLDTDIEFIQEELDTHNATTLIDWSE